MGHVSDVTKAWLTQGVSAIHGLRKVYQAELQINQDCP